MKIAVYPGSFDPVTNGHLQMIERASKIFDKLYVLVALNSGKNYVFSVKERVELVNKVTAHLKNVEVVSSDELVYAFAKKVNAKVIIKGIRNHADFDNELTYYQYNHEIDENIETLLMFPNIDTLFVSSSGVKELIKHNGDINKYVPSQIVEFVYSKVKERLK